MFQILTAAAIKLCWLSAHTIYFFESKDVAKIENLSRNITEIINLGIVLHLPKPTIFFTPKLAEVNKK